MLLHLKLERAERIFENGKLNLLLIQTFQNIVAVEAHFGINHRIEALQEFQNLPITVVEPQAPYEAAKHIIDTIAQLIAALNNEDVSSRLEEMSNYNSRCFFYNDFFSSPHPLIKSLNKFKEKMALVVGIVDKPEKAQNLRESRIYIMDSSHLNCQQSQSPT